MFEYRHALVRLRAGDTVREIARNGLVWRDRLGALRALAQARGWLSPDVALPDDATLAAALGTPKRAVSTVSDAQHCWRRCNSDHPRRSNLDQGRKAGRRPAICG